ncbi:Spherulation-specific family 4-domain-containing protein [Mycena olivaceomarginata]|nr:Spherulation-specific family 4-domain-containing protein [Mycena olivaceomarginata]
MCCYAISILLIQLFVAPCIHALGILLPLYVYPGTNCAAWSPVFDAISANANTQWYIVIDPDNGPGSFDQLYETCVSKLPASANQVSMGRVDTTGRNVLGDIDTYAGWPSSSRPLGIFFDNVSPTTNQLSTYQSYVSHAKSKGFTFIGLDPGQMVADSSYFSIADLINTYEDSYSSFNPDSLSGSLSKQSVTLVNSPTTGSYGTVISQLESKGVAAVYISTASVGSSDLPTQLSGFASEVASVGGEATSSGSTGTDSGSTGSTAGSGTTSGSGSVPASTAGSLSVSSKSPSKSQSASTQSSPSSSGSPVAADPNDPVAASSKGTPIAAVVGGVLGGLVILLILLLTFWCMRRRRQPSSKMTLTKNHPSLTPNMFSSTGDSGSFHRNAQHYFGEPRCCFHQREYHK